jgi:hypothetical protein
MLVAPIGFFLAMHLVCIPYVDPHQMREVFIGRRSLIMCSTGRDFSLSFIFEDLTHRLTQALGFHPKARGVNL